MIVDPDFLDHWRTRMLVDALGGDEFAPMYVMRIWAHCQQRRADSFEMPAAGLKALCRTSVDADHLEQSLIDAGFVCRDGASLKVPKWSEKNASLIAAWANGSKGGKPPAEPKPNPRVTQPEPTGNPDGTQAEPIRLREEKSREKKEDLLPEPAGPAPSLRLLPASKPDDCPHQAIVELWHEVLPEARRIRDWTPARQKLLLARWREDEKRRNLDWWRNLFGYIRTCPFLMGERSSPDRKPFDLSLPWLLNPENFAKVREGAYEEKVKLA